MRIEQEERRAEYLGSAACILLLGSYRLECEEPYLPSDQPRRLSSGSFKMWRNKLHSIAPLSTALFRRGRPPALPSTAAASFNVLLRKNSLSQNIFSLSSSRQIEVDEEQFSFCDSSSRSRDLHTLELCLGLSGQNSRQFCSGLASAEKLQCWNCNSAATNTMPFLFCQSCGSVQPVNHSIDYFRIFGLERKYNIEGENLEGKYKGWQKKLHPDLVHTKSQKDREYAAEQSARVTHAYRTLTDQLSRATYILKLEGVDVDEEERISDPELLAEIMDIRESVEEAADMKELYQIKGQIQEKFEYWSRSFAEAFQSRKYDEALASIQRMTYYKRANEEIVKKL